MTPQTTKTVETDRTLLAATDVDLHLLQVAYARKPLNMWLSMAVAPIGMALVWPHFPSAAVLAWGLAVLLTSAIGLLEARAFLRANPGPESVALWRRVFIATWVVGGLGWAVGPILLFWQTTGPAVAILVAILFAVTTAVIVSVAEIRAALVCVVVVILLPPALSALFSPVAGQQVVGLVLMVAVFPLLGIGYISSENIRRQVEAQLQLQGIFDNAQDAVFTLDADGVVGRWNSKAQIMFGRTLAQVVGRPLDNALLVTPPEETAQPLLMRLLVAQANSPHGRFEMLAQRLDGSTFAVEIGITRSGAGQQTTFTAFMADISKRKEAEEKLVVFRRLFEASSQSIVIADSKGFGLCQNPAHEKTLGYLDEEVAGAYFMQALPAESAQVAEAQIRKSLVETGAWSGMLVFRRKNGDPFTSQSSIGSIVDAEGRIQYLFNVFTDVTDMLAGREALRVAKEEAERANRAKSDFLSNMSHELRTPLNAILGFAQVLAADHRLGTEYQDNVAEIVKGGRHLLHLINEVLDLAELEAGKVRVVMEPVRLSEMVDESWRRVEPLAAAGQLSFHTEVPRHLVAQADRTRLKQVVTNLMSNAIKYNRRGGAVAARAFVSDVSTIRLEVTDTGIGIPPDRLQDVFKAFVRVGNDNGKTEGAGIGLNIARNLVELMQGQIGVVSDLAAGTTFWVTLPLNPAEASEGTLDDEEQEPPESVASGMQCVLCIDDNPLNLKLIGQILTKRPHVELITAPSPGLGIQLALSRQPDLILLDINMPGMDGYQVLEVLKNYERTKYIPVIAVTANATPRDIALGGTAGLVDYLTKPLNIKKFLATVDEWLAKKAS